MISFAEHHNISQEVANYIIKNTSPLCKCGKYKNITTSKQSKVGLVIKRTCGNPECEPLYGKKRPEHSLLMKELAISGPEKFRDNLMKKGVLFNKEVNTTNFKRKKLENIGIDCSSLTDNQIIMMNGEYESNKLKSRSNRTKVILTWIEKWENDFLSLIEMVTKILPSKDYLDGLSDDSFNYIYKRLHGINTIRNWCNVKESRTSWFKRIKIENLHHNTQGKSYVITKSGLEAKYIEFFEDNCIPWSYESVVLETIKKDGFHIPDFLIEYANQSIMIETKGSFYRQEITEYFNNKVAAAINYCNMHDIRYILTTNGPNNFLDQCLVDTKGNYNANN